MVRAAASKGSIDHPVVHVSFGDALAYATWAGKELPTEAEWEFAARGGLDGAEFAWGDQFMPGRQHNGQHLAWRIPPPQTARATERTSPVRAFPPNGYGLYDMIGNVWEWTTDWWSTQACGRCRAKRVAFPTNPRGGPKAGSYDPHLPDIRIPRKVIKGGSHLCAPNYCRRYRPAARHAEPVDTSTSHLGFRCVIREKEEAQS